MPKEYGSDFSTAQDFVRLLGCKHPWWLSLGPDARFLLWRLLRVKGYDRFAVSNVANLQKELSYPRRPYAKAEKELIHAGILMLTPMLNPRGTFNYLQVNQSHIKFLTARHQQDEDFEGMDHMSFNEEIAVARLLKLDAWLVKEAPFRKIPRKEDSSGVRKFTPSARLLLLTLYGLANEFGKVEKGLIQLATNSALSVQQVEYNLEIFLKNGLVLRHITGNTSMPFFGKVPGVICMNICVEEIFQEMAYTCVVLENGLLSRDDEDWGFLNANMVDIMAEWYKSKPYEKDDSGAQISAEQKVWSSVGWRSFYMHLKKDEKYLTTACENAAKQCEDVEPEMILETKNPEANIFTLSRSILLPCKKPKSSSFIEWIFEHIFFSGAILEFPSQSVIDINLLNLLIYRRTSDFLTKKSAFHAEMPAKKFGLLSSKLSEPDSATDKDRKIFMRKIFWTYILLAAKSNEYYLLSIASELSKQYPISLGDQCATLDLVPMLPYKPSHANRIDRYRVCVLIRPIEKNPAFYLRIHSRYDICQQKFIFFNHKSKLDDFANFQEPIT
jgi:hypothetical protein